MRNYRVPLEKGETIELESSGSLCLEASGRWRIGEWIKTGQRLLFIQAGDVRCRVKIDSMLEVSPCEREYSYKKRRCLKIIFSEGGDTKTLWLITPDIHRWEEGLASFLKNTLTEEDIVRVAHQLDHAAEKALWHLYRRRHATIDEIAKVSGVVSHMDTLNMIRKEINRTSKEIIGRPVLVFRQEDTCRVGCQKVAYSWWFAGCKAAGENPFCDVINESEFFRIIVESPPNTEVNIAEGRLRVRGKNGFSHAITLPEGTTQTILKQSYSNGILEIDVMKQL